MSISRKRQVVVASTAFVASFGLLNVLGNHTSSDSEVSTDKEGSGVVISPLPSQNQYLAGYVVNIYNRPSNAQRFCEDLGGVATSMLNDGVNCVGDRSNTAFALQVNEESASRRYCIEQGGRIVEAPLDSRYTNVVAPACKIAN